MRRTPAAGLRARVLLGGGGALMSLFYWPNRPPRRIALNGIISKELKMYGLRTHELVAARVAAFVQKCIEERTLAQGVVSAGYLTTPRLIFKHHAATREQRQPAASSPL